MTEIDIDNLDLNLLKVFDLVMRERSVTHAADILGLGQPAVSHALGRLRAITGDKLFVRGANGMEPTPRAAAMAPAVRQALYTIEQALRLETAFDPATAERNFSVAAADFVEASLISPALAEIADSAPGVTLTVLPLDNDRVERDLIDGTLDLALGIFPRVASTLRKAPVLSDRHVCVFSTDQTGVEAPLDLETYTALDHIVMSERGDRNDFVDDILADRNRRRHVSLVSPNYLTMAYYVQTVPLVATVPGILTHQCELLEGLAISPLPFEAPEFTISTLWHGRQHNYPPLVWLRRLFTGALVQKS